MPPALWRQHDRKCHASHPLRLSWQYLPLPAAEGALRRLCPDWRIDSAGTGDWHAGEPPYGPMQVAARARGIDLSDLRARQIRAVDARDFDVIFAMDASVLRDCAALEGPARLALFRTDGGDVPDPYYNRDFDACLDIIEAGVADISRSVLRP